MRILPLFALLGSAVVATSCGDKDQQQAQAAAPAMPFAVQPMQFQDAVVFQEYTANLEGQQNVEIRPKVAGFIQKIYVEEGQAVRKGQLLFQLETNTLNEDAAAAKAMVNAAQVEVDRLAPLVERQIISNVQLETAKARLAQAKSSYGSLAANIGYARVTSPVDGYVGSLPFKEGALVSTAGNPLTTVSDSRKIRAYFTLNEMQMIQFAKTFEGGTLAEKMKNVPSVNLILADGSTYDVQGKLASINAISDQVTGTTQFRADFDNPQAILRSGGKAKIQIPVNLKQTMLIPQQAVSDMQGKMFVYVVGEGNKVKQQMIQINGISGLNYVVTSGLNVGDKVVVEGIMKLRPDMEIVPQTAATTASQSEAATQEKSAK